MPALVWHGRRLRVSGDELAPGAVVTAAYRLGWTAGVLAVFAHVHDDLDACGDAGLGLRWYLGLTGAVMLLSAALHLRVACVSLRGTPVDMLSRRSLPALLTGLSALIVANAALAVAGAALLSSEDYSCADAMGGAVDGVLLGLVVCQFFDLVGATCAAACCMRPAAASREATRPRAESVSFDERAERAMGLCERLCCCAAFLTCGLFGSARGGEGALEEVSSLLTAFFDGHVDVVASDVLAGALLLRQKQHHRLNRALEAEGYNTFPSSGSHGGRAAAADGIVSRTPGSRPLAMADADDAALLRDLEYWCPYAVGVYGWMLFAFMHPCLGVPRLLLRSATRHGTGAPSTGDNCCNWHQAALRAVAPRDCHLVFANFNNSLQQPPYAVLVDVARSTVVVTVRGTLSLEDVLTDAMAVAEPLDAAGARWGFDGAGGFAHKGILGAAEAIRGDLERSGVLRALLLGEPLPDDAPPPRAALPPATTAEGFDLLVTGHSLGAGTAALLAMLLRPAFPGVRCVAYSAPGALLSLAHAQAQDAYVTTLVLGKDLVPRLSVAALERFRDETVELLARSRVSKAAVMRSALAAPGGLSAELLHRRDSAPEGEFADALEQLRLRRQHSPEVAAAISPETRNLFLPGRVVHLARVEGRKFPGSGQCCGFPMYTPTYAQREAFDELLVSSRMVAEHLPDVVWKALRLAVARGGGDVGGGGAAVGAQQV